MNKDKCKRGSRTTRLKTNSIELSHEPKRGPEAVFYIQRIKPEDVLFLMLSSYFETQMLIIYSVYRV